MSSAKNRHKLPPRPQAFHIAKKPWPRPVKWLFTVISVPLVVMLILVGLRVLHLLVPFQVPTATMAPALCAHDHVFMENFTYQFRPPHRGDVITFHGDNNPHLHAHATYVMRVVAGPGDQIDWSETGLLVNQTPLTLHTENGDQAYALPILPPHTMALLYTNLTLGKDEYYVLGDGITNSFDSRYWGAVPRKNITGRMIFRYYPMDRLGWVQ